jgi:hypothetical protein
MMFVEGSRESTASEVSAKQWEMRQFWRIYVDGDGWLNSTEMRCEHRG